MTRDEQLTWMLFFAQRGYDEIRTCQLMRLLEEETQMVDPRSVLHAGPPPR